MAASDLHDAARSLGFSDEERSLLSEFLAFIEADPRLLDRFTELSQDLARSSGISRVQAEELESTLGIKRARSFYLALALSQVGPARKRREALGIPAEVDARTMADLPLWLRRFRAFDPDSFGITLEILDWSQTYLRGDLVRLGSIQFELYSFGPPLRVFRNRRTRELVAAVLEENRGAREANLSQGIFTQKGWKDLDRSLWEIALEQGSTMLRLHLPADADWDFAELMKSIALAYRHFEKLEPAKRPLGACGEAWLFDPQMVERFRNPGLKRFIALGRFYPSSIPEAKTIRRLYGPDVDRTHLASLPREGMTSLQKLIASMLADPSQALSSRGGFVLREELEAQPEFKTHAGV